MITKYMDFDELDFAACPILPKPALVDSEPLPEGYEFSLNRDEDMFAWKKTYINSDGNYNYPYWVWKSCAQEIIVKLKIPKEAPVVFTPTKCRASAAVVLEFYPCMYAGWNYPIPDMRFTKSFFSRSFMYVKNHVVIPDYFDPDPMNTCSHGIHFFRTYNEAADFNF